MRQIRLMCFPRWGGFDLAGITGFYLGAAANGLPVVADGVITAAAALCAVRLCPTVRDYMVFSHASRRQDRFCWTRWRQSRSLQQVCALAKELERWLPLLFWIWRCPYMMKCPALRIRRFPPISR